MKNEINRIKIRKRCMPETNSSSSHAVSISMGSNFVKPGDKEWDITIEDGILKIPGGVNFGWEYFRTNSVLTKLQYLCGIYCSDIEFGQKRICKLKKILKEIFGVKKVEFLWINEFFKELKEKNCTFEDVYYAYPEIDHNSHDIFEDIIESKETIRHFLLSRDSWLFGGNDNSEEPEGFYNNIPVHDNTPKAIISIELGGEIGRVDWEVCDFPIGSRQIIDTLVRDNFDILSNLSYNLKTHKLEIPNIPNTGEELSKYLEENLSFNANGCLYKKSGKYYVMYCNNKFYDIFRDVRTKLCPDNPYYAPSVEALESTMSQLKEGEDYILYQVKIKLLDYNYSL